MALCSVRVAVVKREIEGAIDEIASSYVTPQFTVSLRKVLSRRPWLEKCASYSMLGWLLHEVVEDVVRRGKYELVESLAAPYSGHSKRRYVLRKDPRR